MTVQYSSQMAISISSPQNAVMQTLRMVSSSIEEFKTLTEHQKYRFIGEILLFKIYCISFTAQNIQSRNI